MIEDNSNVLLGIKNKLKPAVHRARKIKAKLFPPPKKELVLLHGNEHSQVLMPLDYPPSRMYSSRWGNSTPAIEQLNQWFLDTSDVFFQFMNEMLLLKPYLNKINFNFKHENLPEPGWIGGAISPFDAAAIYAMLVKHKPKIFLEIGSGVSTCFANKAIVDHGLETKVISIDPEPRAAINEICDDVIREGLETVDLSIFSKLESGDILFLDGSHRSFMNSDVTVFFIDVLPRLKPGVIVHIHDVFLPYDYPEFFKSWYWNEQYLLAVYMMQAKDRIIPLLPTAFISVDKSFESWLSKNMPLVDLGADHNLGWRGGGSMWFTHK